VALEKGRLCFEAGETKLSLQKQFGSGLAVGVLFP
jgi:hypothetical protein